MIADFAGDTHELLRLLATLSGAPGLRVVVNHIGGPRFDAGEAPKAEWAAAMRAAAAVENVWMKVSVRSHAPCRCV